MAWPASRDAKRASPHKGAVRRAFAYRVVARQRVQKVWSRLRWADHKSISLGYRRHQCEHRSDRGRGERSSIVKLHSRPELEFPALEIGVVPPGSSQRRLGLRGVAERDQAVEYQRS